MAEFPLLPPTNIPSIILDFLSIIVSYVPDIIDHFSPALQQELRVGDILPEKSKNE